MTLGLDPPTTTSAKRGRPADPERRERRREEILATAAIVFAEHGYRGTDVQQVAEAVGVGKGTIYRQFPTKRELFLAAADRGMGCLGDAVDAATADSIDGLDRIERGVRGYLAYFDAHPELIELIVLERAEFKDRPRPTYFAHRDARIGPWTELFAELIDDGLVCDRPVERITDVISDLLYGTIFTNHFAGRRPSLESQAQAIIGTVFHGILTPRGAAERSKRQG